MAKRQSDGNDHEILEKGDVFFFYRPKVETDAAHGLDDVQRFYMIVRPERAHPMRLMVVGYKRLPDIKKHERAWGFVEDVSKSGTVMARDLGVETYDTKTRGERHVAAARPAGEGVYCFLERSSSLYFAYQLELPDKPGEVQKAFNIAPRASFAFSVKNPQKPSPTGTGLDEAREVSYPKSLQKIFRDRRFAVEDTRLLDYEGAQFILVGARSGRRLEEGVDLEAAEDEEIATADLFKRLNIKRGDRPLEPLSKGEWPSAD